MTNLKDHTLVYSITALPNVLFANVTNAAEPLSFDYEKFVIPDVIRQQATMPIEVRIYLFGPSGNIIEMTSNTLPASPQIICKTAELSGLKLVKKLMDTLGSDTNS